MSVSQTLRQAIWIPPSLDAATHSFLCASDDFLESYDPATTELVARIERSIEDDVHEAVARARRVVEQVPKWSRDGARRAGVLLRFAQALRSGEAELAELLTREQGKRLVEARVEVAKAANLFEYYGGLCRAVEGRTLSVGEHADSMIMRVPLGVVAVILPWNSPLILLARALAPALAAGNACIVKPASLTSAVTVQALSMLASDPALPEGTVTCVCGDGSAIGDVLVGHEEVDMISFTGSTATGSHVMTRAAMSVKKICLELGGKSPNIVFRDAALPKALAGVKDAIFSAAGQDCTAGSRLLLERSIYDEFLDSLLPTIAGMNAGDGLDPSTDIGPLASANQQRSVEEYLAIAREESTILVGGDDCRPPGFENGYFIAPTVVADVSSRSRLAKEEIFGPVLVVQPFSDEDEAVSLANDTKYGLAAGLWTQNLDRCFRVARKLNAGTVWINTYHHFYPEAEGGGFKHSGIGRQQGVSGLIEYTQTKHMNFDTATTLW